MAINISSPKNGSASSPKNNDFSHRPLLGHMLVSVNRHLDSPIDNAFSCQFALYECQRGSQSISLPSLAFSTSKHTTAKMLSVDMDDKEKMIVWRKTESGQLGRIQDDTSFVACVLDYQNSGKGTLELYVVDTNDMLNLPEYYPQTKMAKMTSEEMKYAQLVGLE